jgi:hypothetical protein
LQDDTNDNHFLNKMILKKGASLDMQCFLSNACEEGFFYRVSKNQKRVAVKMKQRQVASSHQFKLIREMFLMDSDEDGKEGDTSVV